METLTSNEKQSKAISKDLFFAGYLFCMLTAGCMIGWAFIKLIALLQ